MQPLIDHQASDESSSNTSSSSGNSDNEENGELDDEIEDDDEEIDYSEGNEGEAKSLRKHNKRNGGYHFDYS